MSAALTSFRDLLGLLDREQSLRHVTRPTRAEYELVAVMRKVQKSTNAPLLFENVIGSRTPVATNILSRRDVLAAALGCPQDRFLAELVAMERATVPVETVTDAPVQEIVLTGDVDVGVDIPQVIHCERDGGAYVSAGVCIARHPLTGTYNASWNRIQLVTGSHARIRMMPPQHLGQYQALAERSDQALPVAVAIGAPPALMLSAASKIPMESDEYQTAGAWQRSALRVVPAKTVPLLVPADAEFIIEGEVKPHIREEEGPFGEFTDAYAEIGLNHVLHVSAITRRSDAIYHVILAGGTEDSVLLGVPLQALVLKAVSGIAEIRDVGTPGHIFGCVISMGKKSDEQSGTVLKAAMAAHPWMKIVVVVDSDVNPHDADEVLWAIHTRTTPDTGLYPIAGVGSFQRSDVREVHRGKFGIDATAPMHMRDVFRRRRFPGMDDIQLKDYLGP